MPKKSGSVTLEQFRESAKRVGARTYFYGAACGAAIGTVCESDNILAWFGAAPLFQIAINIFKFEKENLNEIRIRANPNKSMKPKKSEVTLMALYVSSVLLPALS